MSEYSDPPVAENDVGVETTQNDPFLENLTKMLPSFLEIIGKMNRKEPSTSVLQGLTDFIGDTMVFMRGASPEEVERLKAQIVALRKMRNDFEDLIYEVSMTHEVPFPFHNRVTLD